MKVIEKINSLEKDKNINFEIDEFQKKCIIF